MLVFRRGQWHDISIPDYVDPSWGFGDRQKAASIVCGAMLEGVSFEEAWARAEREIYRGSSVFGKQHRPPQNKKDENGVTEES
jgi:hypothetical protein